MPSSVPSSNPADIATVNAFHEAELEKDIHVRKVKEGDKTVFVCHVKVQKTVGKATEEVILQVVVRNTDMKGAIKACKMAQTLATKAPFQHFDKYFPKEGPAAHYGLTSADFQGSYDGSEKSTLLMRNPDTGRMHWLGTDAWNKTVYIVPPGKSKFYIFEGIRTNVAHDDSATHMHSDATARDRLVQFGKLARLAPTHAVSAKVGGAAGIGLYSQALVWSARQVAKVGGWVGKDWSSLASHIGVETEEDWIGHLADAADRLAADGDRALPTWLPARQPATHTESDLGSSDSEPALDGGMFGGFGFGFNDDSDDEF